MLHDETLPTLVNNVSSPFMFSSLNSLTIQRGIGAVFLILGGWALVSPQTVIDLCIRPEYHNEGRIAVFSIGCFGAQAILGGLFATFSRFSRATFLAFGLALIPFFIFDVWFTWIDPILTPLGGILDGIGNIIMLGLCVIGYQRSAA